MNNESIKCGVLREVQSPLWQSSGGTQGQHLSYGYSGGQLTTLTQGAGTTGALTTTFGYSGTQLVTVTTPGGHAWSIGYDTAGRVSNLTSPADPATGTPAYTTAFTYLSGQTQVVEGAGSAAPLTTTYTLDSQGEATGITDGLGHTSSATYDADHDLTSSTDALGHTTSYTYTYVGPDSGTGIASTALLTQTMQPAPNLPPDAAPVVTRYHYNATYDLVEADRPNGSKTLYTYDRSRHRVMSTAYVAGAYTCVALRAVMPRSETATQPALLR